MGNLIRKNGNNSWGDNENDLFIENWIAATKKLVKKWIKWNKKKRISCQNKS